MDHRKSPLPSPQEEGVEEGLSHLWFLRERGVRARVPVEAELAAAAHPQALSWLLRDGLAEEKGGEIALTRSGESLAAEVVRRNRLAERLLIDVLDLPAEQVEEEACRIEHVLSRGAADAICALLGHPKACPHGQAIPAGACCLEGPGPIVPVLRSLDRLRAGEKGRVAYLSFPESDDTQRLIAMGLAPGAALRVEQRAPAFVVSVGENVVAMEAAVAQGVFVRAI